VDTLTLFAWQLATCSKDDLRDGKTSLLHATKACELTKWKNPICLDTVAAAHAECGDFEAAVRWQTKALEIGFDDKATSEKARHWLELYRSGKPRREP
jgi:hypothetical protein